MTVLSLSLPHVDQPLGIDFDMFSESLAVTSGSGERQHTVAWMADYLDKDTACLFAASKELLAVAKSALMFIEDAELLVGRIPYSFYKKNALRAAIAKAEYIKNSKSEGTL